MALAEYQAGYAPEPVSTVPAAGALLEEIEAAKKATEDEGIAWWYEQQTSAAPTDGRVNIFFTAAPVENRTDGARPMRIRSMAEVATYEYGAIRLLANDAVLHRRGIAVRERLRQGKKPGFCYAESSTSPMLDNHIAQVSSLLMSAKRQGVQIGWFVRDLHWLSEDAVFDSDQRASLIARGTKELDAIERLADEIYCPSPESAELFDELLREAGLRHDVAWRPLPPGISVANTLDTDTGEREAGVDVVYSGGYGGVYSMNRALEALAGVTAEYDAYFVVRPDDVSTVEDDTQNLAAVTTTVGAGDFSDFLPQRATTLGLVLLDSDYGKNSFPFKIMSYLEKGIAPVAYADSAAGHFLQQAGAGYVLPRDPDALREALETIISGSAPAPGTTWSKLHHEHTWSSRYAQVARDLGAIE
ncbi:hypothetical protein C1Y63_12185 [Corynebacterium sp. 13CS0277]|nr:hypothetical protein C1Y63_12185 [Corynebacterium sp. 13CS0277]